MSSKRITGLTERTNLASGDYVMLDNASLGSAKYDATKLAEPPWELLNDFTLEEAGNIDLTADSNGTPYNLLGVYIYVYYPANLAAGSGYGRYRLYDSSGTYCNSETGGYTTSSSIKYKNVFLDRRGNLAFLNFTAQQTTGNNSAWAVKYTYIAQQGLINGGVVLNFGNVVQIATPSTDIEPAGTRIQIYGQRAYS